ncbi:MAG TPA: AAA family ATPase [Candidatus Gracilibacteria bacterium]|nr:AAA family ATPase [Candidatus Gracilibacteria bacterium]
MQFFRVFLILGWWYGRGSSALKTWVKKQVSLLFYGLAIRILFKNLMRPMYGMKKFYERWISFVVRVGHFSVLLSFALIGALMFYSLWLVFLLMPAALIFFAIRGDYLIAGSWGITIVSAYFLWYESTLLPLKQRLSKKRAVNKIFPLTHKDLKKILKESQKLDVNQLLVKLWQSKEGKELAKRLEISPPTQLNLNYHREKLEKTALKNAYRRNKIKIEIIDFLEAHWELREENDHWWKLVELKENQINKIFDYYEWKKSLKDYQKNWSSYASFQNKYGIDRGMTSSFSKKLNEFSHDVTRSQHASDITPLISRERIYQQILNALKHKGNALLLIGKSGVGKSRMIEHLAENIAADTVPSYLEDMRVVELDMGRILSGDAANSSQEGGKNLIAILDESVKAPHIILTIDNLVQVGGDNFKQMSNLGILSKYLEQKKISLLATSTQEDYDTFLSKNPTYIRHFTPVYLDPLNDNETEKVLAYTAINLERKHQIIITQKCFSSIVDISNKHFGEIANPAQSLLLLEEAVIMHAGKEVLSSEDVKETLARSTGIRITKVGQEEGKVLANLETKIHETMVGQDYAVRKISDALRRARLDLHDYHGPIAKFLFVGPTGVGKTELAKTVARLHFGAENKMLRLDMSEYQDVSAIHRLLGDANTPGLLTEPVRHTPHILILFDELEKAHSGILNLFLQLLDDGRLTDGRGRTVDFRNTVVIATSNAGAMDMWENLKTESDFQTVAKKLRSEILVQYFRPEFLNRFSDLIIFEPLSLEMVSNIAQKMLLRSQKLFAEKDLYLYFTKEAAATIAQDAFTPAMGARPLLNLIKDRLESELAKGMLSGKFQRNDHLLFTGKEIFARPRLPE